MRSLTHHEALRQRVGRQLLGPLEDALALARRYREIDDFRAYVAERAQWVLPVLALLGVAAIACGFVPVMTLAGASAASALAALLLTPVALLGCLFVLVFVFFSWLEERSLARALGRRRAREPKALRWMRKRLGVDLGRRPRVPWLLAALFVGLPFAALLALVPALAATLLALLVAAPVAFARLDTPR